MRYMVGVCICLLIPALAIGAGFAKGSLFLSQSTVSEGDTVFIHTVVTNDSAETTSAEVIFSDNEERIGTAPVTLYAGEARTVSLSWKPSAGTHKVTAEFTTADGERELESETFTVAEKKEEEVLPPVPQDSSVQSSENIQDKIASYSPTTASTLKPGFNFLDSARTKGVRALDSQINSTKNKIDQTPKPGIIAGTETSGTMMDTMWFVLYTLYFYFLTILRYVLSHAGVFYPVIAVLFLFLLWRILRRIRRPSN